MSTKGDHPMNREAPSIPDLPNARSLTDGETTVPIQTTKHNTAPGFDPWKFGTHEVSAELRQEILEKGFPETPESDLFTKKHRADGKPLAADTAKPEEPSDARRADTLRLHRHPPLVHPIRAAAPWLLLSAVGVFLLLWFLIGRDGPKVEGPEPQDTTGALPGIAPKPQAPVMSAAPASPVAVPTVTSARPNEEPSAAASAPSKQTEPKPVKTAEPSAPRSTNVSRPAQASGVQAPPTPAPASTPTSSRIVPADD